MQLDYQQKLTFSIILLFTLFTTVVALLERSQEKQHKTKLLEARLDALADIAHQILTHHHPDSLTDLLPPNLRLTQIDPQGNVLYDNTILPITKMENHLQRPEIIKARTQNHGSHLRTSATNQKPYLYYAKKYDNRHYLRLALPYDLPLRSILRPNHAYLYTLLALFALTLPLIHITAGRLSRMIRRLKRLTDSAENQTIDPQLKTHRFPNDELGQIGAKIILNFNRLKESEQKIIRDREKLLQHVHSSEEGLCFFSADKTVEFYNGLFIQYLNILSDGAQSNPAILFNDPLFRQTLAPLSGISPAVPGYHETKIEKQGRTFLIRTNLFDDSGFEIILNDITRQEKTRLLKQEITGNITHELRTPVTGIRGCLETLLKHNNLPPDQKTHFLQQAYHQTVNLTELIRDISLIGKIEAAPLTFNLERIEIKPLLEELKNDLCASLRSHSIDMHWDLPGEIAVKGNRHLLYSIFRNLTDNVIRYAGNGIRIEITRYAEDRNLHYFSYADTGTGIRDEQHLNRLFERFYRITEGRTRDTGGSGLGLSIVKNAVTLHRGTIIAKNRPIGGLEFLFSLQKATTG